MSPRRAAVLRGAGDGQNLREHLIATAERQEGDVAENLRTHVRYSIALHRTLLPLMAGLGPEPEVVSRFAGPVGPDTNWRDELLSYLHAERDLGRLAPGAPVGATAAMIVAVCHELVRDEGAR